MKWVRIISIIIIALGLVFQNYFVRKPDIRESIGRESDFKTKNEKIVQERKDLLLPDMKIHPPKQIYVSIEGSVKYIRFDTGFANIGEGPLELIGVTNPENNKTTATQVIYKEDGTKEEMLVGEFVFHPGHKHWHVEKYAQFQLWSYDANGEPTELKASTDKFSFCIWDEYKYDISLKGAPNVRQYPRCPKNIQGNSVGWGDTYPPALEGQELDISGVEDGKYMINSSVNAENRILESDYANNSAILYIELKGNRITILNKY
jgi:hypothetical protein